MMYSYWFVNFFCWVNMLVGLVLGALGWKKYGKTIEEIFNKDSKK